MGIFKRLKELKNYDTEISKKKYELNSTIDELSHKQIDLNNLKNDILTIENEKDEIVNQRNNEIAITKEKCQEQINAYHEETERSRLDCESANNKYIEAAEQLKDAEKEIDVNKEKIKLYKSLISKIKKLTKSDGDIPYEICNELDKVTPTIELQLHSFDVRDLKTLIKENKQSTDAILQKYEKRYTTKSNKSIYQLMVLALRAEMQNILVSLKYTNYDKCTDNLNDMINKFQSIANEGNQQIAPTIKNFIEEIRVLFTQSLDIEYRYYVKKEQEKAEQQALKEQMRQEAEERKILQQEKEKIEKEEQKYINEIENTKNILDSCNDDEKIKQLLARINELNGLLEQVEEKKDDIISRQNGKAGNVYVISNVGSFGENRFKVGMTRRSDPMDRVKELGDASVPFSFDVHSFIFSEDAPALETELHKRLNDRRTNKINMRKEFFDISLDELENLVYEVCPTADFTKTMLATEYRKGLEL